MSDVKDDLATYLDGIATKVQAMSKAELRRWHAALEAERTDQSWKKPHVCPPVQVIRIVDKVVDVKKQQRRDQIMFHAGRYAAGATDKSAVAAQKNLQRLLRAEA